MFCVKTDTGIYFIDKISHIEFTTGEVEVCVGNERITITLSDEEMDQLVEGIEKISEKYDQLVLIDTSTPEDEIEEEEEEVEEEPVNNSKVFDIFKK